MRILIYGGGAIGLYLSVRLAQADHDVTLKARGETLSQAGAGGPLVLQSGDRSEEVSSVSVIGELSQASDPYDLVILATRAWQVEEAAAETAPVLSSSGRVLTTQNGVDAPAQAGRHIPQEQVLAGTAVVIAERTAPLTVRLTGAEAALILGSPLRSEPDDDARRIISALLKAGILARWEEDILTALWKKLALVASYGGVGALAGVPVGLTRAVPQTKALVRNAMLEVFNVGNARGANLQEQDLEDIMRPSPRSSPRPPPPPCSATCWRAAPRSCVIRSAPSWPTRGNSASTSPSMRRSTPLSCPGSFRRVPPRSTAEPRARTGRINWSDQ